MRNQWSKQITYGVGTLRIAKRILDREPLTMQSTREVKAIVGSTLETLRWMCGGTWTAVRTKLRKHGLEQLLDAHRQS